MTPATRVASRLSAMRAGPRGAVYAGLGALAGLGQSPWGLWPVTIVALAIALSAARHEIGLRRAIWAGWALGAGYFALTLHWIVQPFLVDVARHGWMAPFALLLMAAGAGAFWAAAFGLAHRLSLRSGLPALIAMLALAELARSLILTGFPWALIGHVWIGTPIAQLSAITGPHGLTLFTLALAGGLAAAGLRVWLALPALVLAAGWIAFDPGPPGQVDEDRPLVRIVQPNARQDLKWQPGMAEYFYDRLLTLSIGDPAGPVPDVTIWPETAVQWLLEQAEDRLARAAHLTASPVVTGIQRREGRRYFNSLVVVDEAGAIVDLYDKWHLVPFGEYMPLGEVMARFGIHGLAASEGGGYTPGDGPALVRIPGLGSALALICYEGIFAEEVRAAPNRPDFLLLLTNDAWFGNWAGPEQHLAQARLRAIEQGLPLVRAANTGISAMIDAKGRILGEIPLNTEGTLDLALPAPGMATPYSRYGDWPVGLLLFLLSGAAFYGARRE